MSRVRSNVGLYRLRKGQDDLGALRRIAQQQLVISIAEVAGFEQDRRRIGAPQDVEGGETVRIGPQLLFTSREARSAESLICERMARSASIISTAPPRTFASSPAFSRAASPAASASDATSDSE